MRFYLSNKSQARRLAMTCMLLAYNFSITPPQWSPYEENRDVTVEDIEAVVTIRPLQNEIVKIYGDYIFYRMVKLEISFNEEEGWVEVPNSPPHPEYQSWSKSTTPRYDSYESLLTAAAKSINVELSRS